MADTRGTSFDEPALRTAVELAGLGLWRLDLDTARVTLSARAADLYGCNTAGPVSLARWRQAIHPPHSAASLDALMEIAQESAEGSAECEIIGTEGRRRLRETWRVSRWVDGSPAELVGVTTDITEAHEAQSRRRELVQELQHRIKNMLAVVRSLARRTALHSETLESFEAHFDGRLAALALVQTSLARTRSGTLDLEDIVRQELVHSLGSDQDVSLSGPAVELRGKTAEQLALALHELAANSIKFSPRPDRREITISWRLEEEVGAATRLLLEWIESGLDAEARIGRRGFGMDLIERGLPYELDARVSVKLVDGSLRCRIDTPMAGRT
jgi:two-component system, chemotaxis family, CheB/CheR fusion protein